MNSYNTKDGLLGYEISGEDFDSPVDFDSIYESYQLLKKYGKMELSFQEFAKGYYDMMDGKETDFPNNLINKQ